MDIFEKWIGVSYRTLELLLLRLSYLIMHVHIPKQPINHKSLPLSIVCGLCSCRRPCKGVKGRGWQSRESSPQFGNWEVTLPETGTCLWTRRSRRTPEHMLVVLYLHYGGQTKVKVTFKMHFDAGTEMEMPRNGHKRGLKGLSDNKNETKTMSFGCTMQRSFIEV